MKAAEDASKKAKSAADSALAVSGVHIKLWIIFPQQFHSIHVYKPAMVIRVNRGKECKRRRNAVHSVQNTVSAHSQNNILVGPLDTVVGTIALHYLWPIFWHNFFFTMFL